MSVAMASSIEADTVYVRLVNEPVDVWRPVAAESLSENVFRLLEGSIPDDEAWAFEPGDEVVVEARDREGERVLVAVARVIDRDPASAAWMRKTA